MNLIAAIILITLISEFILSLVVDMLNLNALQDELPDVFQGIYDRERYQKSQAYLRVNTQFGWITGTFFLFIILLFWFSKGFAALDQWIRSLEQGPVISGLLFIGSLIFLRTILFLPFSIYDTFVIEERFEFNKTTWTTFIKDRIKIFFLAVLLGAPLLSGILLFFEYAGGHAWWLCWLVVSLYALAAQVIVPTWIMPLFNRFDPLPDGELKHRILSLADEISFPLDNVYVMDGSKRSGKSNAFFTGFGNHKRIVLFDTLIDQHTPTELIAILAHEIGHYKKKHIMQTLIMGILETGLMFFLLSVFLSYQGLFDAFYMEHRSVYAGLIFFGMLFTPVEFFIGICLKIHTRKIEFEADRYAATVTRNPDALISALKKLSVENLSNLIPHPWYVFFNYTHPPVLERIKVLSNTDNFS